MNKVLLFFKAVYDYFRYVVDFTSKSYSVTGEDILINKILQNVECGFYLDIGAHHPFRFSNTFLLHKRGWRGLNIDPRPGSKKLFEKFRPKDITYEVAISSKRGIVELHTNKLGALGTISKDQYLKTKDELNTIIHVESLPISEIFDLESIEELDFINIDTEGSDFEILKSIDIRRMNPLLLCIEDLTFDVENPSKSLIHNYLVKRGYVYYCFIPCTLFYIRSTEINRNESD